MGRASKNISEPRVHHIAFINAKELIKDGYHLVDFGYNEEKAETRYNLTHDNGNYITIISTECDNQVNIYKKKKLVKTIKL